MCNIHFRYETLNPHIRSSPIVRRWFAQNALLNPPNRLAEYILIAPSPEVRSVFVKLVVLFCHFAINDEKINGFEGDNLCEQVLIQVLNLLKSEVAEHGKHLPQYFSLFVLYVSLGFAEKQQLLKVSFIINQYDNCIDEETGMFRNLYKIYAI